jgi:predicted phosphate transport protein (TIGR00153 family)
MIASTSLFTAMIARSYAVASPALVTACNVGVNGSAKILRFMAFRLIPREERFYADFQALADELKRGAALLEEMVAPDHPKWDKADEIKEVEHKCDFLTHEIIQRLNRTFVTPLDREDIHALARSLDDVMDAIDASASLVRLYRLESVRFGARELAQIITASTHQVRLALEALEQHKGLITHAVEINRLENEADRVHQQAVSRLFDDERDPLTVIKWKETLDFLEDATDRCEDVANVLEGVMVKHG